MRGDEVKGRAGAECALEDVGGKSGERVQLLVM